MRAVRVELAEPRALLGTALEDELAPLVSHCTYPVSSGGGGGGCFLPAEFARVTPPYGARYGGCSAWRLAASVPCSSAAVQVGCHQVTRGWCPSASSAQPVVIGLQLLKCPAVIARNPTLGAVLQHDEHRVARLVSASHLALDRREVGTDPYEDVTAGRCHSKV